MGKKRGPIATDGKYELRTHRGTFVVQYIESGERCRLSLKVKVEDGEQLGLRKFYDFVKATKAVTEDQPITIGKIFAMYIEDRRAEGKKMPPFIDDWKSLRPTFENLRPADLEKELVVDGEKRTVCHRYALEKSKAGHSRDTIWTRLTRLRSAINWADKKNILDEKPYVWVPSKAKPKSYNLTVEECLRLVKEATTPHIKLFIIIALNTGARTTAILELTWDRVDFEKMQIRLEKELKEDDILLKVSQKGRATVQMNVFLAATLMEFKKAALTDHVIEYNGKPIGNIKKAFKRACVRAGLPKASPHTLRHTAATRAFEELVFSDQDPELGFAKISRMLGHKDIETTKRIYIKYDPRLTEEPTRAIGKMFIEG